MTRSVGSYLYSTFQELELNGHVDILIDIDMFCLHPKTKSFFEGVYRMLEQSLIV